MLTKFQSPKIGSVVSNNNGGLKCHKINTGFNPLKSGQLFQITEAMDGMYQSLDAVSIP